MFKPATRSTAKIKMALTGPSGSGKTLSALKLAAGLVPGGRIAVVDTENDSAALYSGDKYKFDTAVMHAPFQTEKYIQAIKAAEEAGYDVLIIDSLSHAWSGEGGLLWQKEQLDARGGNSYTNWAKITPKQEAFTTAILQANIHIIATMRSKQDYVLQDNGKGKQAPIKVGLAPVQREGLEYEFTIVLDIAMNHEAQASKDRTGLFSGRLFKVTEEDGALIAKWLGGAAAIPEAKTAPQDEATGASNEKSEDKFDRSLIVKAAKKHGWTNDQVATFIKVAYGVNSSKELSSLACQTLQSTIESMPAAKAIELAEQVNGTAPV